MILPAHDGGRNPLHVDSAAHAHRHAIADELTCLSRWACWRSRTKKCRDNYKDGTRTAERLVFEALHPVTGRALTASRPDDWVGHDLAANPQGRKPFGGLAFLVREEDGLAVLRHAVHDVLGRLGGNVVHAEQEVDGDGLVVIVRAGVLGARTNVYVPLSGRRPCEEQAEQAEDAYPDGAEALTGRNREEAGLSGRSPYQPSCLPGRRPYQQKSRSPDGSRAFFSSSLQRHYQDGEPDQDRTGVEEEVEEYARAICEQGKTEDPSKWVYGLIGLLKRHQMTPESTPPHLLLTFADAIGEDVGAVQLLVLARWSTFKPHKVPLCDALRAVQSDPSLLNGLPPVLVDRGAILAAAMCKYMGADGQPFALPGRVLAEVLGLRGQQEGSLVVRALVELKLIRKVADGKYTAKLAAEYVWVAAEKQLVPPTQPTELSSASTPVPASTRPGHSHTQTEKFRFRSKLGGFLADEHYLAELMLARHLVRQGRELFDGFWAKPDLGAEYARQVVAARSLLKSYSVVAVCRALQSRGGAWVYSLAVPQLVDVVKAEQARLERQQERSAASPAPPTETPEATLPRPAFIPKPTLRQKLRQL